MSDPLTTLNPSIVGQAEKAHTAILKRVLAGTTLDEQQWITLQLAAAGGGDSIDRGELIGRVTGAAKFDQASVEVALRALMDASFVATTADGGDALVVTPAGRKLMTELREKVSALVASAYGNIPADDLATAARVLISITADLSAAPADA